MQSSPPWTPTMVVLAITSLMLTGCAGLTGQTNPTPSASPASTAPARITATVDTAANTPLRLREAPSTSAKVLATVKKGTVVTLSCHSFGDRVTGPRGTTDVWQRVTVSKKTGFLSAAYLKGGLNSAIDQCPDAPATGTPTPASRGAEMDARIVEIARSQLGVKESKGNCNPYGGCMAWCALYATWVWRRAGDPIPKFAFTGDLYTWGKRDNRTHDGIDGVGPGDLVLYGTGPKTTKTSTHVDIVIEVFPDHLRVIGGNVKDKVTERDVPLKGIYGWVDA